MSAPKASRGFCVSLLCGFGLGMVGDGWGRAGVSTFLRACPAMVYYASWGLVGQCLTKASRAGSFQRSSKKLNWTWIVVNQIIGVY